MAPVNKCWALGEWPFNSCQWYLLLHWRIAFHIKIASKGALTLYWKFCFCVTGLRLISLERSPNVLPDQFYRLDPFGWWYKMWIKILGNMTEYYVEKNLMSAFLWRQKKNFLNFWQLNHLLKSLLNKRTFKSMIPTAFHYRAFWVERKQSL